MDNFGGSVTLCGGGIGFDEIAIGQESNYCLSLPPADGFTATTPCTAPATTTTTEAPTTTTEAPATTTTTEAPSACYYYRNDSMDNFGGSVTLCGGSTGYDEIAIGETSNYCLSLPPAAGFTENGSCP
jgi:hypothetical protein